MNQTITYEMAQQRADELENQYEVYYKEHLKQNPEEEGMSFGEWVMTTHYPNINCATSNFLTCKGDKSCKSQPLIKYVI